MVNRECYLAKLRLLKDKNMIKVITGIRRSGKSTILELFRKELLKHNSIFFCRIQRGF